eukprot:2176280-Pyramimonas_sp.AAC.1
MGSSVRRSSTSRLSCRSWLLLPLPSCSTRPLQSRGRGSALRLFLVMKFGPTRRPGTPPIVPSQCSRL